ncbi:MAG TPA: tRNA lysidine(34) synthetase TilS [Flavobacterium sp.]|nr:tRNA lysidine(34) synthetase TilS [Flavobacterium sp.]
MINTIKDFIQRQNLLLATDKILIGVSGGIDSTTLCHILIGLGYKIEIAHCNFSLRGNESDEDELFVKSFAQNYQVPFHSIRFDTLNEARLKGMSIQMAARELRYNWFQMLLEQNQLNKIVTAHNANDNIETFFVNISRETGLKGLTGMPIKNGNIVRPMLEITRNEIEQYALKNKIAYREDSSNASTKYTRNKIRHEIIPVLKQINPTFEYNMKKSLQHLNDTLQLFESLLQPLLDSFYIEKNDTSILDKEKLKTIQQAGVFYELFQPYGFHSQQIEKIRDCLEGIPGKQFESENYQLLIDRSHVIIEKKKALGNESYFINDYSDIDHLPIKISIAYIENSSIEKNSNIACLDESKLQFPLQLRKWKQGDKFMPLGMNQYKKLSDFFIDQKINCFEKENIWVLCSEGNIVWIAGIRIDEQFKVDEKTRAQWRIALH